MIRSMALAVLLTLAAACGDNINVPPNTPDLVLTTAEDTPLRIEPALTDDNGDEVTFSLTSEPTNGTIDPSEPIYTPAENFNGTDVINYVATDGFDSSSGTITIEVTPVNDAPTISAVVDLITTVDAPVLIPFGVDDVDTPIDDLRTAASSSDQAVVPRANIELGGTGANRDVLLTPAATGQTTITLFVLDGDDVTDLSFSLTVDPAPTLQGP